MTISQLPHLPPSFGYNNQLVDMSTLHPNTFNLHPNTFLNFKHEGMFDVGQIESLTTSNLHPNTLLDFKHDGLIDVGQIETLTTSTIDNSRPIHHSCTDQIDQIKFDEGIQFGIEDIFYNGDDSYNSGTMMAGLSDQPITSSGSSSSTVRKRTTNQWTVDEHKLFILGLKKYGKGDWKSISRNYVTTRSSTQVASHAQKFFKRHESTTKRKRSSIHDIVDVDDDSALTLVVKGLLSPDKASSIRTSDTPSESLAGGPHYVQLHSQSRYPDYSGTNANSSSSFQTQQNWDPLSQLQWDPLPQPQWQ